MAKITTVNTHASGIALGGIGAGSVELLPDGEFHFWQIANPPRLTTACFADKVDDGEGSTGALSFYVREKKGDNAPVVRKLGMKIDADDFTYRMFAWNKPVERIDFDGKFPLCDLDYIDRDLSCKLHLRAVSPFVPFNSDVASTPGFYLDFTAENPTDNDIEFSLLGTLVPDFANKTEGHANSLHTVGNGYAVHIEPANKTFSPNCGDVCLSVSGDGNKSYITADYFRFLKEFVAVSDLGITQESVLFGFRETGVLPNTDVGTKPAPLPAELASLSDAALDTLCDNLRKYPHAASILNRILHCKPDFLNSRENKIAFLDNCHNANERKGTDFGGCALCSNTILKPGETKNIRFILTWYFPHLAANDGDMLGHYYENLYASSLDANKFLEAGFDRIFKPAAAFAELLYTTDLPATYPDAWSSLLSPLIKCSVYHKNGRFGLWEGQGFCGLHTTDITYHASFSLISLFPNLQKRQMTMGAEYQREDGRMHHTFMPDMKSTDDGFDRVDMNMQFVLMVLRDYLFTGDKNYLLSLWDNVQHAMDCAALLDTDHDGLPDSDTRRNTYDAWNFTGTPVYIALLWLAALKAATLIAERVGDKVRADQWSNTLLNGQHALEEKLWNGAYYNLWRNGDVADECLMTDQLDGEWFLRMIGLDGVLPDERVRSVVEFIFQHNFDSEQGLVNATIPANRWASIDTYNNCQAIAVWTGIGYAFAALALAVGETEIPHTIVDSIHNNQLRLGHFWDHWECGHHYTRPMSSWSTLLAASGLKIDHENKTLRLKPMCKNMTFPLVIPGILAKVTVADGQLRIETIQGDLNDWEVTAE